MALLWETTAATMRQMAVTETVGRRSVIFWVYLPKNLLIRRPRPMGIRTTWMMDRNIDFTSTLTVVRR